MICQETQYGIQKLIQIQVSKNHSQETKVQGLFLKLDPKCLLQKEPNLDRVLRDKTINFRNPPPSNQEYLPGVIERKSQTIPKEMPPTKNQSFPK
jgi:hypothetical protein